MIYSVKLKILIYKNYFISKVRETTISTIIYEYNIFNYPLHLSYTYKILFRIIPSKDN